MATHAGYVSHNFCRHLLAGIMKEVRQNYTPEQIKAAWAWSDGRDFEFHGPNGEYIHNLRQADCLYGAKAEGWSRMLEAKEILKGIPVPEGGK